MVARTEWGKDVAVIVSDGSEERYRDSTGDEDLMALAAALESAAGYARRTGAASGGRGQIRSITVHREEKADRVYVTVLYDSEWSADGMEGIFRHFLPQLYRGDLDSPVQWQAFPAGIRQFLIRDWGGTEAHEMVRALQESAAKIPGGQQ